MLMKTLAATSALVATGSIAMAGQHHGTLPRGETWETLRQHHSEALRKKMPGVILTREGVPIAILRMPTSPGRSGPGSVSAEPALLTPGGHDNFGKDKNALYLGWFGWLARNNVTSATYSGSYCISYSANGACLNTESYKETFTDTLTESDAAPLTGAKGAGSIKIAAATYSGTGAGKTGLYSNHNTTTSSPCGGPGNGYSTTTATSCPANPIAGASGTFTAPANSGYCCADIVATSFGRVKLDKKSQYWVVTSARSGAGIIWFSEASNFTRSAATGVDYRYNLTSSYKDTYRTSRSGHSSTHHGSYHTGSDGWVHAGAFTGGDWPGAFSVE